MIKQKFIETCDRVNQLSFRERLLVLLCSLAVIYFLWSLLLDNPAQRHRKRLYTEIQSRQSKITMLNNQAQMIIDDAQQGPSQHLVKQKGELMKQLGAVDQKISSFGAKLITADKLTAALQQVLATAKGVKLLSFSSSPVAANTEAKTTAEQTIQETQEKQQGLTEYQFTMVFEGNYFAIYQLLKQIEGLGWLVLWDQLDYQVTKYPMGKVTIKLHTLSVDP